MDGVVRMADPDVGGWVADRLRGFTADGGCPVGSVVPSGFDAVVRVLHPVGPDGRTWASVAAATGRRTHPLVQWPCIAEHFNGSGRGKTIRPREARRPRPSVQSSATAPAPGR